MTKRQSVKCPKCGKEYPHQGALNLHLNNPRSTCFQDGGGGDKKNGQKKEKKNKVQEVEGCPECSGGLRALNPRNPQEKEAILQGYSEVCIKCQELI